MFNVGDYVEIRKDLCAEHSVDGCGVNGEMENMAGEKCRISNITATGRYELEDYRWVWDETFLEKLIKIDTDEKMFKVGDYVILNEDDNAYNGKVYEVDYVTTVRGEEKVVLKGMSSKIQASRFRLATEQEIQDSKKKNIEELYSKAKKMIGKDIDNEVKKFDRYIKDAHEEAKNYLRRAKQAFGDEKRYMAQKQVALANSVDKDYSSEINNLLEHRYVEKVEIDRRSLIVFTDYIDIYDNQGNKFKGNKYKININFEESYVTIFGLDSDYNRESYWSESDPHPHVNGDNGEPCLGDAGSMLSMTINDGEIYASFIVVLNFLQQVNLDDVAGKNIGNWDCIDEDGNDIDNPHEKDYVYCAECEHRMEEDASEHYICSDCDAIVCDDHAYYIDNEDKMVCSTCRDQNYSRCDSCDELYHDDKTTNAQGGIYCEQCLDDKFIECDECGDYTRRDDSYSLGDDRYCESCYDDLSVMCDKCQDNVQKEDTFTCEKCGEIICTNCSDEYVTKDGIVCHDCYEEDDE